MLTSVSVLPLAKALDEMRVLINVPISNIATPPQKDYGDLADTAQTTLSRSDFRC